MQGWSLELAVAEPLALEGCRKKADFVAMSTRTQPSNSIPAREGQHTDCESRAEWDPSHLGVFSCSRAELVPSGGQESCCTAVWLGCPSYMGVVGGLRILLLPRAGLERCL